MHSKGNVLTKTAKRPCAPRMSFRTTGRIVCRMYTSKLKLPTTDLSGHNNSRGRNPSEALWSGNSLLRRHTKYSCLLCLGLELRPSSLPIENTSAQQNRHNESHQVLSPEHDAHALVLPSQRHPHSLAAARGLADRQQPQRHSPGAALPTVQSHCPPAPAQTTGGAPNDHCGAFEPGSRGGPRRTRHEGPRVSPPR